MINFITISGDWNFYRYFILMICVSVYAFTIIPAFILYVWHEKILKNKRDLCIKTSFILIPFILLFFSFDLAGRNQVGADKWMQLAQAESTLLQLQVTNDLEKKNLPFDRQAADNWIKNVREQTSKGSMNYRQFYSVANQYNDLYVGLDDIRNWFKSNSTDSIRKELENNMQAMVERNQQAQPQQAQPQQPQQDIEDQKALEMENKLNSVLQ